VASVCIVSDSTALFPNPVFTGRDRVHLLPSVWKAEDPTVRLKASDFPASLNGQQAAELSVPSEAQFEKLFRQLGSHYDAILAILHAGQFSPAAEAAQEAASTLQGSMQVRVIDSGTISLGLGLLVQTAAEAAERGLGLTELDLQVRNLLPRIYGLLCIPGLTYLRRRGYVNPSQAVVGEYLNICQVYALEEGELVPSQTARNPRHLVDVVHEFLSELDLEHVSILQGAPPFEQETRALRERLAEEQPGVPVSEQIINAPFASFIGPHSLGVFALER
jgi:DegV family protein with EDD domain